jgi:hypothetical protein
VSASDAVSIQCTSSIASTCGCRAAHRQSQSAKASCRPAPKRLRLQIGRARTSRPQGARARDEERSAPREASDSRRSSSRPSAVSGAWSARMPADPPEQLGIRPVRKRAAVREATRLQPLQSEALRLAPHLIRQPRLPDPWLSRNGDEPTGSLGRHLLERRDRGCELGSAADQGGRSGLRDRDARAGALAR